MAPLPPARWLAALALLEVRRTLGFMTAPGDEVVTKDVTGYRLMAWAWLSLLVAYLVVSLVYGVFRFVNNRRVKPTAKFVGPLGFFLRFLVNYPCLTLLLGLAQSLAFSAAGLLASDFVIPVDWEVGGYMDSDSDIRFMEEAVTGAVAEQEESLGQSSRRLLYQPQTLKYWTLDVYYTAKDEGGSVFTEDAMAEIRRFERSMFEFAGYEHFCHVDRETMECSIPNSVASIFNPSVQRVNGSDFDSTIEVAYDGQGECLSSASVADAVAALNQAGVSWWWDAGFDGSSASGMATRSQFRGGAPLGAASATAKLTDEMRAETQEFLHSLSDDFLSKANDEMKYVTVSWQEERFLDSYEIFNVLLHDVFFAGGSLLFVLAFLLFQLRSVVLTIVGAIGVLTSFTTAFYWYRVVAGFESMNLINFISLFLIVGIAADDILVMSQMYDLGHVRISEKRRTPQNTMKWAYYRAGSAMLVTTITTCGSFFALCTSSIKVLRAFGFFMGATVAWNYINVMIIFPPVVLMVDIWWKWLCPCCYRKKQDGGDALADVEADPSGATARDSPSARSENAFDAVSPRIPRSPAPSGRGPAAGGGRDAASEAPEAPTGSGHALRADGPLSPGARSGHSLPRRMGTAQSKLSKHSKVSKRSRVTAVTRRTSFGERAKVNLSSRVFRDCLGLLLWHLRWPLVGCFLPLCLILGGLAVWRMSTAGAGLPVFSNETNAGRQEWILDGLFGTYDTAVLGEAMASFPSTATIKETCPGVSDDGCTTCSGHGRCSWDGGQYACSCDAGWFGMSCALGAEAYQVSFVTPDLSHVVVLSGPAMTAAMAAVSDLVVSNDGATPASWQLQLGDWVGGSDWVALSDLSGDFSLQAGGPRSIATLTAAFDLTGKPAGWRGAATARLVGTNSPEPASIELRAAVAQSLSLSNISLTGGGETWALADFDPDVAVYDVLLGYERASVRVVPFFFEAASAEVRAGGRRLSASGGEGGEALRSGESSAPVELEVQAPVAVTVTAVLLGASNTYTLNLIRQAATAPEPPRLLRAVAAGQRLAVTWAPPAYDGGKEVTAYEVVAVASGGAAALTASVACQPAGCYALSGYDESSRACCEHELEGLADGESYTVSVMAVNDVGTSGGSSPEMCADPSCFPWLPVMAGGGAPAIGSQPTATVVADGKVEVSVAPESVDNGGAVPLWFVCTPSPGAALGSASSEPGAISISELPVTQAFSFSCTVTNAGGEVSAASPSTPEIMPTLITGTTTTITTLTSITTVSTLTQIAVSGSLDLELSDDIDPDDEEAFNAAMAQAIANMLGVPVSTVQITSAGRRLSQQDLGARTVQFTVSGTTRDDLNEQISGLSASDMDSQVNAALSQEGVGSTAQVESFGVDAAPTAAPAPAPTADPTPLAPTAAPTPAPTHEPTTKTSTSVTESTTTFWSETTVTVSTQTYSGDQPPSAPSVVAAVSGPGEINVSVTASPGNKWPISRFICNVSLQGTAVQTEEVANDDGRADIVFSSLDEGSSYQFSCIATNDVGASVPSEKISVTAIGVPAPPVVTSVAVTGVGELTLHLSLSSTSAAPVESARCRATMDEELQGAAPEGGRAVTVAGLTPGAAYRFECSAANGAGSSAFGAASTSATAVGAPLAPAVVCLTPGAGLVQVTVADISASDPARGNLTAVECYRYAEGSDEYQVFQAFPSGGDWAATVTGLPNGQVARVQCRGYSADLSIVVASSVSDSFACGHAVAALYELRGNDGLAGLTHAELRGFLEGQLAGVALESIFVATSTDGGSSFNTCLGGAAQGLQGTRRLSSSASSLQVQARVLVNDTSDQGIGAIMETMRTLTTGNLQSWAATASVGDVTAEMLSQPEVLSSQDSDSTLGSLEVIAEGFGHSDPMLEPPFDASYGGPYSTNVTSVWFKVVPRASSDSAHSVLINGEETGRSYEIEDVYPARMGFTITVTAADRVSTSTYFIWVSYPEVPCSATCHNGYCNGLSGQCECREGYSDGTSACSAFCPGSGGTCSGHGKCCDVHVLSQPLAVQESLGCSADFIDTCACDLSYTGEGCSRRECPDCQNGRPCLNGTQDLESAWTCDCGDGFTGNLCQHRKCPNDCSGNGVCDTDTGECACSEGWELADCSWEAASTVPIENAVEVQLVWGISEYNQSRQAVYDLGFRLEDATTQRWLLDTCAAALAEARLQVRPEIQCWIDKFAADMNATVGFPVDEADLGEQLVSWFGESTNQDYMLDVGTADAGYSGRVRYAQVRMRINVRQSATAHDLEAEYLEWADFVDRRNAAAPAGAKMLMVSSAWTRMDTELSMVRSSTLSVALSIAISFGVVTLFTGNLLLSGYLVMTIILAMMALFFCLTWIVGMEFGPIQIIGLTTFVGLSVDYTLHTCHGYHESAHDTARGKATDALMRVGPAILGGALTTAGATVFLFPCWILPFYQLGVMLFLNTLITLVLTFFFLIPLLMVAGPRGECCDIYAVLFCRAVRRALQSPDEDDEDSDCEPSTPISRPQILEGGGHAIPDTAEAEKEEDEGNEPEEGNEPVGVAHKPSITPPSTEGVGEAADARASSGGGPEDSWSGACSETGVLEEESPAASGRPDEGAVAVLEAPAAREEQPPAAPHQPDEGAAAELEAPGAAPQEAPLTARSMVVGI